MGGGVGRGGQGCRLACGALHVVHGVPLVPFTHGEGFDTLGIAQPGHFRIAQDVGFAAMGVSQLFNEGIWRKVANRFGYVQQAVHTRKPMQQPYDAVTPCGMCTIGFPASSWVS